MGTFADLLVPTPDAFAFMADLAAREAPSGLKKRTPTPSRAAVTYPFGEGRADADLYMPGETAPRAGLLLVPGVAVGGKDDARLIAFATSLARLGFAVMVPELAELRQLNVRPHHRDQVAAAFRHFVANPIWAPEGRAGIGGLSFAMGPGVIAALLPDIREKVRFLFCVGGYYDLEATMKYVTTGIFRERGGPDGPGPWRYLRPDDYGRWVLASSLVDGVPDAASREVIRAMIDRRIATPSAAIDDLMPGVTCPAGRALVAFIVNTEAERFEGLFNALPLDMRRDIGEMDVSRRELAPLKARLILVHGYDDDLVPYAESLALGRAATTDLARVYLVKGLAHVNLGRPGPLDAWRLLSSVTALLAERGPRR